MIQSTKQEFVITADGVINDYLQFNIPYQSGNCWGDSTSVSNNTHITLNATGFSFSFDSSNPGVGLSDTGGASATFVNMTTISGKASERREISNSHGSCSDSASGNWMAYKKGSVLLTVKSYGDGTVSSSPMGINCNMTTCTAGFDSAASVTLTATPAAANSVFGGWGGACSGTGGCTVSMSAARTVTATFYLVYTLSVTKAGAGSGRISGSEIDCGATCSAVIEADTFVSLFASPDDGSVFTGWSGDCTGTNALDCGINMSGARSVTANFDIAPRYTLSIIKAGTGSGTVTSDLSGISCGASCSASFTSGTSVLLYAQPAAGSTFVGWSGACAGADNYCRLSMDAVRNVTANFSGPPLLYDLSVNKKGTGSGAITSNPIGIACGTSCYASFNPGARVTLTATPTTGSIFTGWSGDCSGVGDCIVNMSAPFMAVWATFKYVGTADGFIDHNDGTVTHLLTGLMWMRCTLGQSWTGTTCTGTPGTYSWDAARSLTLSFVGESDWRLPSPWELVSIVDYANEYPAINTTVFPNTPDAIFWSASADAYYVYSAWIVDFYVGGNIALGKTAPFQVRLVRGGQSMDVLTTPTADFTDNLDGTVTHRKTGLTWKRCAEGQVWADNICSASANTYTFDQAKLLPSSFAGKADWRLPNIQQLVSIVEYGANKPAINSEIFPNLPSMTPIAPAGYFYPSNSNFWSISPRVSMSDTLWQVDFLDGLMQAKDGDVNHNFVRLVRGEQSPNTSSGDNLPLLTGWNLLGNGSTATIDVNATFADANRFISVWKWNAISQTWAFYSPSLAAQGGTVLADYVNAKGYQPLASIAAGEGFWVNAKQTGTVSVPSGNAVSAATLQAKLAKGWNLVAIGYASTPGRFNSDLSISITLPGQVPQNLISLWAWDPLQSKWYFYAPSLTEPGALNDYISAKGYLDFTMSEKTLGLGVGFWVNRP